MPCKDYSTDSRYTPLSVTFFIEVGSHLASTQAFGLFLSSQDLARVGYFVVNLVIAVHTVTHIAFRQKAAVLAVETVQTNHHILPKRIITPYAFTSCHGLFNVWQGFGHVQWPLLWLA
jgi:hypothetical protein